MGYKSVPVNSQHLLRYIAYLSKRLSASSIPKYLNVIKLEHLEAGFTSPTDHNWHMDTLVKGINREYGKAIKQKLPITPDILLKIRQQIDVTAPYWMCFWSACLTAFFGLLRKGNVFLDPSLPESAQHHIRREDICIRTDSVTFIKLKHTKTIQFGQRTLELPLPFIPGHLLCPVTAVLMLFNSVPNVSSDQPAFMYHTGMGPKPLYYCNFLKDLKSVLSCIGLQTSEYSGHSFRRGGATWAMRVGIPGEAIQLLGDWQSDTFKRYIDMSFQDRVLYVNKLITNLPK